MAASALWSCTEQQRGQGGGIGGQNLTSAAETLEWNSAGLLSDFHRSHKSRRLHQVLLALVASFLFLASLHDALPAFRVAFSFFFRSNIRYAAPAVSLLLMFA